MAVPPGNPLQCCPVRRGEFPLHEQMPVIKQVPNLLFDALPFSRSRFRSLCRWSSTLRLRNRTSQGAPNSRYSFQDGLVDFHQDVKHTDLMFYGSKNLFDWPRIQRGSICGDPLKTQSSLVQLVFESRQEPDDVFMRWVVIKEFKDQPSMMSIVYQREQAIFALIQFVDGDEAGEVAQSTVEIP